MFKKSNKSNALQTVLKLVSEKGISVILILIAMVLSSATTPLLKKDFTFFVGTYTGGESEGIYQYQLKKNGTLIKLGLVAKSENPSFLAKSVNGKYLLAVNEIRDKAGAGGTVTSFLIANNAIEFVDKKPTNGASPCFVSTNASGQVLVANYASGNIALLKITPSGTLEGPLDVQQHNGSGIHPRQKDPHAHSAWFDNNSIISVDLGTNELWFSRLDTTRNKLVPAEPATLGMAPGAGPRHLTFHPNTKWIYVINELNATVTQLERMNNEQWKILNSISTLPADYTGTNTCADIHISQDGKFLYASNRGHNSIAIYQVRKVDGNLSLVGFQEVHGDGPRNFALSPDENFLLVANQRSNNIVSFKRDKKKGTLKFVTEVSAPSPVCLLF